MHPRIVLRILGVLLVFFSSALLPPLAVSLYYDDGASRPFVLGYLAAAVTGVVCWLAARGERRELRTRDGFALVVLFWTVLALFGSVPLVMAEYPEMSFTDAFFESMAGLTTTGSTVLVGIDALPESIRMYRQQLQWMGGMGIIVLAVAIMPMLGVGGMQLYRAEMPGPLKDTKLTPRITETAKALWYIYLGLTVLCALGYWAAGMTPFDAIGHSFSTVAIGGFSTHDASLGYFDNPTIHFVAMVFMLVSGVNFALHFLAWRTRSIACYFRDPEVMVYSGLVIALVSVSLLVFSVADTFDNPARAFRQSMFQVISIGTTTGFTTGGFEWWPSFLPALLILVSFIGGCAGSTAGGVKVIRVILLYKQGSREMLKLVHPRAVVPVKLGGKPISDGVINAVWAFFSAYILCYVVLSLLVTATGLDLVTGFSAVAACLNNLGPGLGEVASNYSAVSAPGKWLLAFAMLLGRLELFTLLVLLTPTFWRS